MHVGTLWALTGRRPAPRAGRSIAFPPASSDWGRVTGYALLCCDGTVIAGDLPKGEAIDLGSGEQEGGEMPDRKWALVYLCRRCKRTLQHPAVSRSAAVSRLTVAQNELASTAPVRPALHAFCICSRCVDLGGREGFGWADLIGAEPVEES